MVVKTFDVVGLTSLVDQFMMRYVFAVDDITSKKVIPWYVLSYFYLIHCCYTFAEKYKRKTQFRAIIHSYYVTSHQFWTGYALIAPNEAVQSQILVDVYE